jgi:ribosomal protein S17E
MNRKKQMPMKSFVLHDDSVNTYGFRMLTEGADLTEFKKNPVMLLQHNDWKMPIGRWENIRKEGNKILGDPVFDENDPDGKMAKQKVDEDFLRMASIGAWPPDEISEAPELKLPGQTGPTVVKWTPREASIVTIGGNHNALVFYDRDTGDKINLNDKNIMDFFNVKPNKPKMSKLNQLLNLADNAEALDQFQAVQGIISERDTLKKENERLVKLMDEQKKADAARRKAEAIALIDAAVKEGRIDATTKDNYTKLFDADFDAAKAIVEALPKRSSVTELIEGASEQDNTELADVMKKSWDELDKAGKLPRVKEKFPEVYKQKFDEKFQKA